MHKLSAFQHVHLKYQHLNDIFSSTTLDITQTQAQTQHNKETMAVVHFNWVDYCVFVLVLTASCTVGVYYCWRGRQKKEGSEDFMMAGRNMNVIPVAASLFVSWFSAVAFIGKNN